MKKQEWKEYEVARAKRIVENVPPKMGDLKFTTAGDFIADQIKEQDDDLPFVYPGSDCQE